MDGRKILYLHTLYPNDYSIHIKEMEKILDYMKKIEAKVLTMKEMYEQFFTDKYA